MMPEALYCYDEEATWTQRPARIVSFSGNGKKLSRNLVPFSGDGIYHLIPGFIIHSDAMRCVARMIEQIARTDSTVMIYGESGTGKELVAESIHKLSNRCDKPYVAVNCATLTPEIINSELFGHEKGSFTGAIERKIGLFEYANKGTIFLDEISELSTVDQAKLLRVLEYRKIRRVGSSQDIDIDTRVICASNQKLKELIKTGRFREDLYYRLYEIDITIPPLRERKEDIPVLIGHFCRQFDPEGGITLKSEDISKALEHRWEGNVRELKNKVARTIRMRQLGMVDYSDEPHEVNHEAIKDLATVEMEMIIKTVKFFRGNKTHAAKSLGISLKTLHNKLNKYGRNRHDSEENQPSE